MNQAGKYILGILITFSVIQLRGLAQAVETVSEEVIVRPIVEYKSGKLRDPFKTYLVKEEPRPLPQEELNLALPVLDLNQFQVQGMIWGVKIPQAIINNKVLTIGDSIEGAEILSIEKKGITLSYGGSIFDLGAPGSNLSNTKIK